MNLHIYFSIEDLSGQGPLRMLVHHIIINRTQSHWVFHLRKQKFLYTLPSILHQLLKHFFLEQCGKLAHFQASGTSLNSLLIADLYKNIRQAIVVLFLQSSTVPPWGFKGLWHTMALAQNLPGWRVVRHPAGTRENDFLLEKFSRDRENDFLLEKLSRDRENDCLLEKFSSVGEEGKGIALGLTCQYASGLKFLLISEMGQLIQTPWVLWFFISRHQGPFLFYSFQRNLMQALQILS